MSKFKKIKQDIKQDLSKIIFQKLSVFNIILLKKNYV